MPSRRHRERRRRPSAATTPSASAKTRKVRRVPTRGISSSADRKTPASEPDGRDRVQPPGHRSRLLDAPHREPQRVGRHRPEQQNRRRDEHEDADERADEGPRGDRVQRVDRRAQERPGRERNRREQGRRAEHEAAEPLEGRVAIGQAAAEPVAGGQRDEHGRDRVRPHDRRGAEVRREQARRRDLGAQAGRADDEDHELEPGASHRPKSTTPFPTEPGTSLPSVTTAELAALDRRVLWHPFTQQEGWEQEEQVIIERAEGTTLYDTDGNAYIDGVSSLWCNVHGHRHHAIDAAIRAPARARRPLDDARPLPPPGDRAGPAPARHRARRALARLLLRQRVDGGGGRAEDGLPVVAARRRAAADRLRLPARGLPRRHHRLGLGRRHRPLPPPVRPAALRGLAGRARRRRRHGRACWRSTATGWPP